ncbi:Pentatricopeptide repeat [Macleaya cordata]|uniref:Pentatricopeptide repeat n=1 Tax=Macleaya cordata TaxID=56857 RepID=A0A200R807_MACCD|nr:Pentatricopeptide repeat [Macleaya cordata]
MIELKQIHALIISFGLTEDESFSSRILSLTAISDFGDIDYSYQIFRHLINPTIFNWNTIIRGYSRSKNPNRSISVFNEMSRIGVSPDHLTFPFLAKACSRLSSIKLGLSIHSFIAKTGFELDKFVQNSLIHMYSSCGGIIYARKVFDAMPYRNLVSWNSIIDGYAKCGDLVSARNVFELMPERDVVSWSSLIDGYVKSGDHREALEIFERMKFEGPKANEVTMVSVLCACAHLGALEKGKMMHKYVKENGLPLTLVLRTSLVDMYAKCGAIEEALVVFRGVSIDRTDVLIWNSMIGGLATHGLVKESLELYKNMRTLNRVTPDEITYLCLLSACAHGGLVEEAWEFFDSIDRHGMTPMLEHYACMVDVLSRAGYLDEAFEFLNKMPVEPTASMLGALLSGCRNYGRLDIGEIVGKKLIELEPDHDGRYIGLSNIYSVGRRYKEARKMREEMEKRGVKKSPGCSSVEVDGVLHKFIAHDKTHPQLTEVYAMLNEIAEQMRLDSDLQTQEQGLYDIWEDG